MDDAYFPAATMNVGTTSRRRFYGWTLLVVLAVALALNMSLSIYGLGILNVHMGDELKFNRAALGSAYALFMLMTGLPGPLVAKLIDMVGIRWTLVTGNALLLIGAVAMATVVTTPLMLLLVAGIIMGFSNAAGGPVPVQASVTRWFSRHRALAMALVISGASVGGMIFAPLLEHLVSATGSWRLGWWLIAGLAIVAAAISSVMVKEAPEDIGQQPDGVAPSAGSAMDAGAASTARLYQTQDDWSARDVARSPAFWLLLACSIGVSAVYTVFLAQGVLHMRDLGYSTREASYLVSLSVGVGFAARLIAGYLGDRMDSRLLWAGALLFHGAGIALFASAHEAWMLYLAVACIGVGDGAGILSLIMVFSNWFGTRAAPFVFGFGSAFAAAFGSLAPVASGFCYDRTGSFAPVFYGISLLCCASAVVLLILKPPRLGRSNL